MPRGEGSVSKTGPGGTSKSSEGSIGIGSVLGLGGRRMVMSLSASKARPSVRVNRTVMRNLGVAGGTCHGNRT